MDPFVGVVGRTSQVQDVNLVLENITFDMQIKMSLPFPKTAQNRDFLLGFLHDACSAYPSEQEKGHGEHPAPGLPARQEEG